MAPQFHNCHTYVVEFSAQAPLNNETAGLQRTVYPYPCEYLSNFCVQVKTCDGDTTREKRTRHSSQKIQRFNCSTIMSVLEFHLALCHWPNQNILDRTEFREADQFIGCWPVRHSWETLGVSGQRSTWKFHAYFCQYIPVQPACWVFTCTFCFTSWSTPWLESFAGVSV